MSRTLFEISNDFQRLYEIACDDDDPKALIDTISGMMPEIEQKAAGYVAVIQQLDMEAKKAKELSDLFKAKQAARENNIKRMKMALLQAMDSMQVNELAAGDYKIKIAKNGGMQPLTITGDVPENMNKIIVEPDNDKIRAFLEEQPDHKCEWAYLSKRGRHINIK